MGTKQAVLFDLDGVLVLSENLKANAHVNTIKQLGGDISPSFYTNIMGQSHETVRAAFIAAANIQVEEDEYSRIFRELYKEMLLEQLEIAPGAINLIKTLAERQYFLAVVSSTSLERMTLILNQTGLIDFFNVQISSNDVKHSKPAPDAYLLALERLSIQPGCAVAIEDSETGIQSAVNAGICVLAVRHSYNVRHDFSQAGAVLESLEDVASILQKINQCLRANL